MGNLRTTMKKEFRVWIKSIRSYLKQYYNSESTGLRYVSVLNNLTLNPNIEGSDCVFEQWTGLYDKNGKKIYEGDILRHEFYPHNKNFVMKWNVLSWELFDAKEYDDEYMECDISLDVKNDNGRWTVDEVVVIGNTFENPELLKV